MCSRPASRKSLPLVAALVALAAASSLHVAFRPGLRAQYFTGSDFAPPAATTAIDSTFSSIQLARRWRFRPPDSFSAQWTGYLHVARAGVYTFVLAADDGARLFVDRQPIVDGIGPGPGERTGRAQLDRGSHVVLLQYAQAGGNYQLSWKWAPEGEPPVPVPAWTLSARPYDGLAVFAGRSTGLLIWVFAAIAAVLAWRRFQRGAAIKPLAEPDDHPDTRFEFALLGLFAVFAIIQTWPLAINPAHLSRNDNADTLLNEWILSWVAHQLPRDPLHLFDANIFYPDHLTLAYSEPLIVQSAIGAPIAWLGGSPVLVYNLVLMAGFALTGWAAAVVVSRWTGDRIAAIAAGLLLGFNAHTLTRMPHMAAQHAEFLPLALFSLDAFLRSPRWSSALWLSLWVTLQSLTSIYLLVFTAVALTVALVVRPGEWLGRRFAAVTPRLALASAVSSAAMLPFLLPYWRINREGFERTLEEVGWYSAGASDYLTMPSRLHGMLGTSAGGSTSLFPGIAGLLLAAAALMPGAHPLSNRRVRVCLAIGIAGVVLSFGPMVPGYTVLYSVLSPLQALRAPARFGYLAIVAVSLVAGFGAAAIRRLSSQSRASGPLAAIILLAAFFEPFVAPIAYQPFTTIPEIYRALEPERSAVAAHLPFPGPDAVFRNGPYMLGSTRHFKPILNGYSGFLPPSYLMHHAKLRGFPAAESIQALREFGVTHVFVHTDRMTSDAAAAVARTTDLERVAGEGAIVLYRVKP